MSEEHIAKLILSDKEHFGKKIYKWINPVDLHQFVTKVCPKCGKIENDDKIIIGFGKWKGCGKYTNQPYICIARNGEVFMLEKPIIKEMWNWVRKRKW